MSEQIDSRPVAVAPVPYRPTGDHSRDLLAFMAGHPFVLVSQVMTLFEVKQSTALTRLGDLVARGLITSCPQLRYQRGAYQITAAGLGEIDTDLLAPRLDLRRYWHDVGAAWLAVAVRRGAFGDDVERYFTEREMRMADVKATESLAEGDWAPEIRAKAADASFGLTLGGDDMSSGAPVHYPDIVLVFGSVGRFAIEFCLEPPNNHRLDAVLTAYARKASVAAAVLYFQDHGSRASSRSAAEKHGLGDRMRFEIARMEVTSPSEVFLLATPYLDPAMSASR